MNRRKVTMVALVYSGYVLVATLYPFEFSANSLELLQQQFTGFFAASSQKDFIVNMPLFIPLGVLLYCRLIVGRGKTSSVVLAALVGAVFSLSIEILQLFFLRHPSAFDVLSNTLGAAAGAIFAALWPRRLADFGYRFFGRLERSGMVLGVAVLFGAVPLILSMVQFVAPFSLWNPRFDFQIGNEATFDRPWLGRIHLVALYNRALPADEITGNFRRGPAATTRLPEGLLSLYTFNEGHGEIVYDRSGVEPSMDLRITPQGGVHWLGANNGIEIVRPAIVRSARSPAKLFHGLQATDELSIEVWMTPDDTMQGGPARIISFSGGTVARNFTLGQEGADVEFRLRTPMSGRNGTPLAVGTSNGLGAGKQAYVVATYKDGIGRLYVNGGERPVIVDLAGDGIIGFGTRKTIGAEIAYSFFYFFPIAVFAAVFFSKHVSGSMQLLPAVAAGAGLLVAAEVFQAVAFERKLDFSLMGYGIIIAAIGALTGRYLQGGLNEEQS